MHVILQTVHPGQLSRPFENKDTIFWVEGVSDLAYELFSCGEIVVNLMLTESGHLVQ